MESTCVVPDFFDCNAFMPNIRPHPSDDLTFSVYLQDEGLCWPDPIISWMEWPQASPLNDTESPVVEASSHTSSADTITTTVSPTHLTAGESDLSNSMFKEIKSQQVSRTLCICAEAHAMPARNAIQVGIERPWWQKGSTDTL